MEETQLIASAQHGDLSHFRLLMEPHARLIWRVMNVLVADPALVEDCMQAAWIALWSRLPEFSGEFAFRTWLLTVIAPCSHKRLRHQAVAYLHNEQGPALFQKPEKPGNAVAAEASAGLEKMLLRLPFPQRRLLLLHFYAGLDADEIALVLALPPRSVINQWQRAVQSLKARFAEDQTLKTMLRRYMEQVDE